MNSSDLLFQNKLEQDIMESLAMRMRLQKLIRHFSVSVFAKMFKVKKTVSRLLAEIIDLRCYADAAQVSLTQKSSIILISIRPRKMCWMLCLIENVIYELRCVRMHWIFARMRHQTRCKSVATACLNWRFVSVRFVCLFDCFVRLFVRLLVS